MYNYVTDKKFISQIKQSAGHLLQQLSHKLKTDYKISATFFLVGSGKRKLIMQNGNGPVDLDYNLKIERCEYPNNCQRIKSEVIKAFNEILHSHGLSDCDDSTSVITTKELYFKTGVQTGFTIDIAIVREFQDGTYSRLIHKKTGFTYHDRYYWVKAPDSQDINKKTAAIKENNMWPEVYKQYKKIKNRYLTRNDHNHPSFVCYIETINNVFNALNQK